MKKKVFTLIGLAVFIAAIAFNAMMMTACDDGSGGDNDSTGGVDEKLPEASGNNAVSGKTYYFNTWGGEKITFSATATGDAKGTYVRGYPNNGTYASGVKFTYRDRETGSYTWNEGAKTVTLKPEKLSRMESVSIGDNDGSTRIDADFGPLGDKTAFRSSVQAMINEYIKEMGQAAVNQQLSSMGFSSVSAYIDYVVNEEFANRTYGYSFSTDGTALFLEEALPANKGTNEFTSQTYYALTWDNSGNRIKDTNQVYVFTASGFTFTDSRYTQETRTGSYAYDSNRKQVWLRPSTINGKNRAAYYAEQTAYSGHHLADDNAYRAARTNETFSFWSEEYNSTNKTIGWER